MSRWPGARRCSTKSIYPRLAQRAGVAIASPVLELDAGVPGARGALKIIGIDPFRAGAVSPDLLGIPAADKPFDMLADDAVFLSPAAMAWLKTAGGGAIALRSGTTDFKLRVAGGLLRARAGQRIGVMDIGAAQWRFHQTGKLSRIDLKLREGVDRNAFERELARELERDFPGRFQVAQPNDEDQNSRTNTLSRAYRVNLTVLALVALFTGAFLVFSTQALSVIRRRSQFALLRVLGVERRQLLGQVLLEGASLGVIGALLGIAAGYALAATALRFFGADLGAGYFSGVQPAVHFTPGRRLRVLRARPRRRAARLPGAGVRSGARGAGGRAQVGQRRSGAVRPGAHLAVAGVPAGGRPADARAAGVRSCRCSATAPSRCC